MYALQRAVPWANLPDTVEVQDAWYQLMTENQHTFESCVRELSFCTSVCDRIVGTTSGDMIILMLLSCHECRLNFQSNRALLNHLCTKHGLRNEFRNFAPMCGTCPICTIYYHTRLRLLGHWIDWRRPECADAIRIDPQRYRLSEVIVQQADEHDRLQRKCARASGLHRPPAVGIVRRAGKIIGRASATAF